VEYANRYWFHYSTSLDKFPETYDQDNHPVSVWENAVKAGGPVEKEVYLQHRIHHHFRCHLLRAIPLEEEGCIIKWVGTFTDIAHQKQANEILEQRVIERTRELQEMNQALEASNHELQQFASVASHDLKEPLRKIQLFGTILRDRHLGTNPDALQYMERIVGSSQRMTRLINDLLQYSRLSAGDNFELVDVNATITEILSDLELSVQDTQAEIIVQEMPPLEAIPGQLRQAFQNIISNALKFTRPGITPVIYVKGERVEHKEFESAAAVDGPYCRITISDNGIGFNEKYLPKIFNLFQRLHASEAYEGTGIGLAIAKKVVEKHQGIISAHSRENEGATFIMVMPIEQSQ
jgi:signal transduction histidine kinase